MRYFIIILITIFFMVLAPIPMAYGQEDLTNNVRAALLIEAETGKILYQKNPEMLLEPASITKLMTYLLAMEAIERGEVHPEDQVSISSRAAAQGGASYDLRVNEEIRLSELLEAMMIVSANDATTAIGEHVGGNEENFVDLMNSRAKELGLKDSSFVNPNGMPKKPQGNMMTASDMAILSRYIIEKYGAELLSLTDREVYRNEDRGFIKESSNNLLKIIPDVDGLKTGFTNSAGYCLISTMEVKANLEDEDSFRLIAIVLGAESIQERADVSKKLLEYGKENFVKKRILYAGEKISEIRLWDLEAYPMDLVSKEDIWLFGPKEKLVKTKVIDIPSNKHYSIHQGQKLGELHMTLNNDDVIIIELISKDSFKQIPLLIYMKRFWSIALGLYKSIFIYKVA